MTSLVLSLLLTTSSCGPQDQRSQPTYCYCVKQAKRDYTACLQYNSATKCGIKQQEAFHYCDKNLKGK